MLSRGKSRYVSSLILAHPAFAPRCSTFCLHYVQDQAKRPHNSFRDVSALPNNGSYVDNFLLCMYVCVIRMEYMNNGKKFNREQTTPYREYQIESIESMEELTRKATESGLLTKIDPDIAELLKQGKEKAIVKTTLRLEACSDLGMSYQAAHQLGRVEDELEKRGRRGATLEEFLVFITKKMPEIRTALGDKRIVALGTYKLASPVEYDTDNTTLRTHGMSRFFPEIHIFLTADKKDE